MSSITIPVTELRPGDQFLATNGTVAYTVITWPDVFGVKRETRVDVRFIDGGTGTRVWDEGVTIMVERKTGVLARCQDCGRGWGGYDTCPNCGGVVA